MAKRRRLEAPSAEQLNALEEGFARETRGGALGPIPPIAQVAADAAAMGEAIDPDTRAAQALDKADAERFREALAEGLVVQHVAVTDIVMDALPRDRISLDPEALDDLKNSIRLHGLRLPIDVFEMPEREEGAPYGLISGYRRLMAFRALSVETGDRSYDKIPVFLRNMGQGAKAYVAMVEENEVRANLSHYERGRIAVMAAAHGAFSSVGEAVNALYESGSKAKRSKIRSFAELHEELGDVLSFATNLSERQGLRLVAAMRNGYTGEMRAALAQGQGVDPASEWSVLEAFVLLSEEGAKPCKQKLPKKSEAGNVVAVGKGYHELAKGVSMVWDVDKRGYFIRLDGDGVDAELVETIMDGIKYTFTQT